MIDSSMEITRTFDLLDHLVTKFPDKPDILAGKERGEWVKYSTHDYYKYAHYMACGLLELGLQPGDKVVTISANCPEWNFIDMALALAGMIHVPVYPTLSADNYLHIFTHSEAKYVFVSNNILLRRIRPALDKMDNPPIVYTLANIEGEHRTLEVLKAPRVEGLPNLTSGLVGTVGWDAIRHWEPTLRATAPDETGQNELVLALATDIAVVDHVSGSVWLIANAVNVDDKPTRADEAYRAAVARLDTMERDAATPTPGEFRVNVRDTSVPQPQLRFRTAKQVYEQAVERSRQHIIDGDVFQVVISQRLDIDSPADPFDVYRVLRTLNPSPYMYFMALTDAQGRDFNVIGSSPETLIKVDDGQAMTFPIAGSRPRGATPEEDELLAKELLADPKETSEHVMLVDLSRNDLSRVCLPQTVEVVSFMDIKRFSHIMHICSTVTGTIDPALSAFDVFTSAFPAGTLSGAPKPRAVEIIDELEPADRGIYGGTIGYFDFSGNMDMAIAIRTAFIRDHEASVQAGAGLVLDSVPATEWQETRNKAEASVEAIQIAAQLKRL